MSLGQFLLMILIELFVVSVSVGVEIMNTPV